jgi:PmbA protein
MAKAAPEDKFCGLLDQRYRASGALPDLDQSDTARPSPEQLLELARLRGRLAESPEHHQFRRRRRIARSVHLRLRHLDGFLGAESATSYSLGTQPVAECGDDMERDYEWRTKRFFADLPSPKSIGRIAGDRAAARLGAKKIASQKAAVIFENRLAGRIIGPFLLRHLRLSMARGVSFLKDKLGQRVFAEGFRIHEDPFVKRGLGSRAFDGEGGAVKPLDSVDDGVITTWLLNSSAARQLNLRTQRPRHRRPWRPAWHWHANLFVTPGTLDLNG